MADSAAQSSLVSSSSSSTSVSSSSASSTRGLVGGSVPCGDPPNSSSSSSSSSSSQPVSLFAASPAAPGGRDRGSSPGGGGGPSPPESPESPFEVVPDRAAFDREFGPALAQIPEGRVCHFPPQPRGGPGRGLARPPPGSAAALEEVSRCVREMHSFTSELLSWDLVERNGDSRGDSRGDSDGVTNGVAGAGDGLSGVTNAGNGITGVTALGKGVTGVTSAGNGITGVTTSGKGVTGVTSAGSGITGVTSSGNGVSGVAAIGNGVAGVTAMEKGVTATGKSVTAVTAVGNGVAGVGGGGSGLGGIGNGVTAVTGIKSDVSATGNVPSGVPAASGGVTAVPTDADSSGDSDDTVIEEAPGEAPPAVPKDVPGAVPAVPKDVPRDVPVPPGSRDWEQEHQTLRALRELGEPPRPPPAGPLPRLAVVQDLLFWRDVKKSAVAFGASLVLLLSLATLSAVTVVAHVALALLSVTISLRVYKAVVQALQKSEEGHPFRAYLDLDVTLSPETFQAHAAVVAQHLNRALRLLVHLFLVEDLVDSLELALTMWLMTYVGAVFNGITLLILADILAFTLPPLYEKYEVQINHYMALIHRQTKDLMAKIQAKLPGLAKKKPE